MMLEELLAPWWSVATESVAGRLSLLAGNISPGSLLPLLSLALLVVGFLLALLWREKQAIWLLPPLVVTALTPLIFGLFISILGWMGLLFAFVVGTILLLVWIGVIAADATRRLPIWLVGWGLVTFVVFCGFVDIVLIWGIG